MFGLDKPLKTTVPLSRVLGIQWQRHDFKKNFKKVEPQQKEFIMMHRNCITMLQGNMNELQIERWEKMPKGMYD